MREKENSNVDISKGKTAQSKRVRKSIPGFRTPWDPFLCQCLACVKGMQMNLNTRLSKTELGGESRSFKALMRFGLALAFRDTYQCSFSLVSVRFFFFFNLFKKSRID